MAVPGRPAPSLPRKLEALQRCGRSGAPLFTAVPLSGRVPIEDVLDDACELKSELEQGDGPLSGSQALPVQAAPASRPPVPVQASLPCPDLAGAVLLGFTRDGCHLLSYTSQPVAAADAAEGYALQLWRFETGQRSRRLWSVPLFRWVLPHPVPMVTWACWCSQHRLLVG